MPRICHCPLFTAFVQLAGHLPTSPLAESRLSPISNQQSNISKLKNQQDVSLLDQELSSFLSVLPIDYSIPLNLSALLP